MSLKKQIQIRNGCCLWSHQCRSQGDKDYAEGEGQRGGCCEEEVRETGAEVVECVGLRFSSERIASTAAAYGATGAAVEATRAVRKVRCSGRCCDWVVRETARQPVRGTVRKPGRETASQAVRETARKPVRETAAEVVECVR